MDNYISGTINNSLANFGIERSVQSSRKLVNSEAKNVDDASKEFEAMFVSQMLRPIFDTLEVDEVFGGGHAEQTWREFMVEEYGKLIADRGGIGIADSVKREMLRAQEITHSKEATNG